MRDVHDEAGGGTLAVATPGPVRPRLIRVARRGPALRPSPTMPGVFGLDLTAGCLHGCPFCHIQGSPRTPADARVLFDPSSARNLDRELDERGDSVRTVVLSPTSDPLPPDRDVRAEAVRVAGRVLDRELSLVVLTRGRVPRALVEVLSAHPGRATVGLGITTLSKPLSRQLEPRAASPRGRLRDLGRLVEAGVAVEARLEPLIAGLTDTRENLLPLLKALAARGVTRAVAHYLFLQPALKAPLAEALTPLGFAEHLADDYEGGPAFAVGTLGLAKHLPRDRRREGYARLAAWGAECGLEVITGAAQNPDLPRPEPIPPWPTAVPPRRRPRDAGVEVVPVGVGGPTEPVGSPARS